MAIVRTNTYWCRHIWQYIRLRSNPFHKGRAWGLWTRLRRAKNREQLWGYSVVLWSWWMQQAKTVGRIGGGWIVYLDAITTKAFSALLIWGGPSADWGYCWVDDDARYVIIILPSGGTCWMSGRIRGLSAMSEAHFFRHFQSVTDPPAWRFTALISLHSRN